MPSLPSTPPPSANDEDLTIDDACEENACEDDACEVPPVEDESEDGIFRGGMKLPDISTSRFPLRTVTISELWAMLLALKVKYKLSDGCLLALCKAFNSLAAGSPREKLPNTRKTISKALSEASNLKRTWIIYCDRCYGIVAENQQKPQVATCRDCKISLGKKLKAGKCSFVTLSIRSQLQSYMENGLLPALRKNFLSLGWGRVQNGSHDEIVEADDLDLTIGCDAAQITKSSKIQIFPVVLFINHVPNNYQLRFPILAALYCGPGYRKPPVSLLMKKALAELHELEEKPLTYVPGPGETEVQHRVYITICAADSPQRLELLNQKQGYYCCPYCYARGQHLSGSVRFPQLITSSNLERVLFRTEQARLEFGKKVCRQILNHGNFSPILGMKGLPVIYGFKHFDATWSCTSDALHVIFEGVGKKFLQEMCSYKQSDEKPWAIRSKEAPTFEG